MSVQIYANNASTTLTSSIIATDLTIIVADGSAFPSPAIGQYFLITIELGSLREIVKVSGRSGNTLTVASTGDRGQEGTSAAPWAPGSVVEGRTTRDSFARFARYEDLLFGYASTIYAPGTSAFTDKSVLFSSTDGKLRQDNANFNYNTTGTLLTVTNATVVSVLKASTIDSGAATPIGFKTNSGTQQFNIAHIASAVNYAGVRGGIVSTGAIVETIGSDTDIDLIFTPKGAGLARFAGAYGYTGINSPAQITATQNNYSPASASSANILRINSDAGRTITGFAGGVSGRTVTFVNNGTFTITFTNEDAGSTAGNRFKLNGASLDLFANTAATFWYDTVVSRWVALSSASAPVNIVQALTDAATINWDTSLGSIGTVTLAGSRIVAAPINAKIGSYMLKIVQDATGSRTITSWNAVFKWPLATPPTLSTAPASIDWLSFFYDGTNFIGSLLKGVA